MYSKNQAASRRANLNTTFNNCCDFYMDLIFSSWSIINTGNNLYVSMCVMCPLKIKFNQGL